ncbi:hypothetical protein V5O48_003768 [Marasmius crinis-equi]|uniref:Uncharacterized protein n=1 Tax=Marasmius crinis-equi TaxID=585013 RepID=A0ABR3FSA3_9AGAR
MAANERRNSSPSPRPSASRNNSNSFSNQISLIGAKINRAFSGDRLGRDSDSVTSASTAVADGANARSVSRGRQSFSSSGRGGLGNIHENGSGYDDSTVVRGRDRARVATVNPSPPERAFSTGRGGVGNIRAPVAEPVLSDAASSKSVPTTLSTCNLFPFTFKRTSNDVDRQRWSREHQEHSKRDEPISPNMI